MEQRNTGECEDGDERRTVLRIVEHGGASRLVVVLDEANGASLHGGIRSQMGPHLAGRRTADEEVVQPLVVAGIEALVEQHRLEVPVGLGPEHEVRADRSRRTDHRRPVAAASVGCRASRRTIAPRAVEHVVEHQHRHVTAQPIAAIGEPGDELGGGGPQRGTRRIELEHLRPGGKVRVAAAREHSLVDLQERRRITLEVVPRAVDEQLRPTPHPRVVRCDMVGDEVEDESHASRRQCCSGHRQRLVATEARIDDVVADAIRGADHVGVRRVVERASLRVDHRWDRAGDRRAERAALPDPHQPDRVDPRPRHVVPHVVRHVGQRHPATGDTFEVGEPHPREDLVDDGMSWPAGRASHVCIHVDHSIQV